MTVTATLCTLPQAWGLTCLFLSGPYHVEMTTTQTAFGVGVL
jgi:hypothetical protein